MLTSSWRRSSVTPLISDEAGQLMADSAASEPDKEGA